MYIKKNDNGNSLAKNYDKIVVYIILNYKVCCTVIKIVFAIIITCEGYLYEDTQAHYTSATLGQVLLSKHISVKNLITFV